VPLLKKRRPTYWGLNVLLAILGAWIITPLTVFFFYLRYAVVGDTQGIYWLIVVIFFIVWFAADSYVLARKVFHDAGIMPTHLRTAEPKLKSMVKRTKWIVPAIIVASACFWWYAELGNILNFDPGSIREELAHIIGRSRLRLDLRYAELSKRRPGFEKDSDDNLFNVRTANLSGRRFRYADLTGANLLGAQLKEADLTKADMTGVDFRKAKFWSVTAREAQFRGVNLVGATLFYVDLTGADFPGADLSKIEGSFVVLKKASLVWSKLREVFLVTTDFSEADLCGADLEGARIKFSNLEGARLDFSNLRFCDLDSTNLQKASLRGTKFSGANLAEAQGLETDQILQACGDEKTQLPQYLVDAGVKLKPCSEMRPESRIP
jgi:uncharacterized protein YjbI with pentapeptide repeats